MKAQQKTSSDHLPIPTSIESSPERSGKSKPKVLLQFLLLSGVIASAWTTAGFYKGRCHRDGKAQTSVSAKPHATTCTQVDPLLPGKHHELWANMSATIGSDEFQSKAVDWLSRAVQIPWVLGTFVDACGSFNNAVLALSLGITWIQLV